MPTRTIVSTEIDAKYANKYCYNGDTVEFIVSTDTGADETMRPISARLGLSRVRSYASDYSINVIYPGEDIITVASTVEMEVNADTHAATMHLQSFDDAMMSHAPRAILLEIVSESSGNCINFREGCVLTLEIDYMWKPTACKPPTSCSLEATASVSEPVLLSWTPGGEGIVNQVTGYEIHRSEKNGDTWSGWKPFASTIETSFLVYPPAVVGNVYAYRVRAVGSAGPGYESKWCECWNTLTRDSLRLPAWTDPTLVPGVTPVRAVHVTELQRAASRLLAYYYLDAHTFTPAVAEITSLAMWTTHMQEIRAAVDAVSTNHEEWLEIPVNCPRADVVAQIRAVIESLC